MIQDFRFALRQLLKTPGFTAVALLTLALAIGVNSAIFALVNSVILRPVVPVRPAEVVNVFTARQDATRDYRPFTYNEFTALRRQNDVFSDVAAMGFSLAGIGRGDNIRRSFIFLASENFFSLLGVKPVVGRFFDAAECRPNANVSVVVASYPYWQKLGGRPDAPMPSSRRISGCRSGFTRSSAPPSMTTAPNWISQRRRITPLILSPASVPASPSSRPPRDCPRSPSA
jgi:hypothetical protein